jgi:hypothetical protein
MTLGLKPVFQILPALLIDRSKTPALIPELPVQASIPAFTQSGTGMVRIRPPLPARSAMTQCSSLCWMSPQESSAACRPRNTRVRRSRRDDAEPASRLQAYVHLEHREEAPAVGPSIIMPRTIPSRRISSARSIEHNMSYLRVVHFVSKCRSECPVLSRAIA